ncbi:hypothetical protein [Devriesea agamarum]|nr:hypothetical protein [Devriesea agamarum]
MNQVMATAPSLFVPEFGELALLAVPVLALFAAIGGTVLYLVKKK